MCLFITVELPGLHRLGQLRLVTTTVSRPVRGGNSSHSFSLVICLLLWHVTHCKTLPSCVWPNSLYPCLSKMSSPLWIQLGISNLPSSVRLCFSVVGLSDRGLIRVVSPCGRSLMLTDLVCSPSYHLRSNLSGRLSLVFPRTYGDFSKFAPY